MVQLIVVGQKPERAQPGLDAQLNRLRANCRSLEETILSSRVAIEESRRLLAVPRPAVSTTRHSYMSVLALAIGGHRRDGSDLSENDRGALQMIDAHLQIIEQEQGAAAVEQGLRRVMSILEEDRGVLETSLPILPSSQRSVRPARRRRRR